MSFDIFGGFAIWRRSVLIHFGGWVCLVRYDRFFSGIRFIFYLFNVFLYEGVLFCLYWEPRLSSGAWAVQLCGSCVVL